MEPAERKKRVLIALAGAAVMLAFVGNFFWSFFKDFFHAPPNGNHGSNVPLLIFGGFFLLVVFIVVANVMAAVRRPANPPPVAAPASAGAGGRIFLILFSLPFAGFGLVALVQAFRKWGANQFHDVAGLGVFGLIFCGVGFGLLALMIFGGKKQRAADAVRLQRPDQPWLWRPDWAAGKIKSTATIPVNIMVIVALIFGGFGGLMTFFVLPKELHNGNFKALFVLLFPAVGLGFLIALVRRLQAHHRYGDCFFELAAIPGALGGTLEGLIQAGARLRLEHGLHLKLSCVRVTVSGAGEDQSRQENILWQDEKVFAPNADLPEPEPGRSGIPVFFKIPANQPECFARGSEAVVWRLEARAKMSGPDFCARFDVPVFQVAGAAAAEVVATDPTAALQMPVEELRRDENSKIKMTDGSSGREFYFPAARNLGTAFFTTLFMLVFNGAAVFMYRAHAPMLFPIVFGLVGVLLILGTFNLWFKSNRITINSTNVQWTKRWLVFSRTRDFSAGDYARFATKTGMQSGSTVFTDIKLVRVGADAEFAEKMKKFDDRQPGNQLVADRFRQAAGPSGVTVANSIASAAEAEWLVKEMNQALGRSA